jgi:hypothetical protein
VKRQDVARDAAKPADIADIVVSAPVHIRVQTGEAK